MRIVIAPDKFRGTLTARQAAEALGSSFERAGHDVVRLPLSDGGEGLVDALGGPNRSTEVAGPLGDSTIAHWRQNGKIAVLEMSAASGLDLVGGADNNDALGATSRGVGQMLADAIEHGAEDILLGVGGSATTDGGLPAIQELNLARMKGVDLRVACDVRAKFSEAPWVFGPQKGATSAEVKLLERRLNVLAAQYLEEFGVDVESIEGSGAAGGLAGGLAAIGASLVPGFSEVAERIELFEAIEAADLVITGEGKLDAQSFNGKVIGGVAELAAEANKPVIAVVGQVETSPELDRALEGYSITVYSLTERFGESQALEQTSRCMAELAVELEKTSRG